MSRGGVQVRLTKWQGIRVSRSTVLGGGSLGRGGVWGSRGAYGVCESGLGYH